MKKIKRKLIKWILPELLSDNELRAHILRLSEEYYSKQSLHKVRVWGDESRISCGDSVHLNNALINTVSGRVVIEDYAFLGHQVSLLTGAHDYSVLGMERQNAVPEDGRDIKIGKGAWIASSAVIIGPCVIGENSVIGAGSVVTGNVEANAIYAGVPAKRIRYL